MPRAWMVELSGVSGWGAAIWGGWEIPAGSGLPEHHPLYPPIPGIPFAAHSAITNVLKSVLLGAAGGQSWPAPQPLPAGGSWVSPLVLHTRGRSPAACLGSLRQQHRGPVGKRVELCACRLLYSPCSPSPAGLRRPITLWRRCPPHSLPFLKILQDCDG